MAKESLGYKVARAARTGGHRRGAGRTLETFHIIFVVIIVLGIGLVYYSRAEALNGTVANSTPPTTKQTWFSAVDFDVCGTILPNLPQNPGLYSPTTGKIKLGFYTTGNGLITIHPLNHTQAGNNAVLSQFFSNYPGLVVTPSELKLPGRPAHKTGGKCNLKTASVTTEVWSSGLGTSGQVLTNNFNSFLFQNDLEITIAYLPNGVSVPKPPSSLIQAMFNAKPTTSNSTTTTTPARLPTATSPKLPTSTPASVPSSPGVKSSLTPTKVSSPTKSSSKKTG